MTRGFLEHKFRQLVDWMTNYLHARFEVRTNAVPSFSSDVDIEDNLRIEISYRVDDPDYSEYAYVFGAFPSLKRITQPIYTLQVDMSLFGDTFTVDFTYIYSYEDLEKYISVLSCFLCLNKHNFTFSDEILKAIAQMTHMKYIINIIDLSNNVKLLTEMIEDIKYNNKREYIYDIVDYFADPEHSKPELVAAALNKMNELGIIYVKRKLEL